MNKGTVRKPLELMSSFFPAFYSLTGASRGPLSMSAWKPHRAAKRIFLIAVMGLAFTMAGGAAASGEQKKDGSAAQPSSLSAGAGQTQAPGYCQDS